MTQIGEQQAGTDPTLHGEVPAQRAAIVRIRGMVPDLPGLMGGAFKATAAAIGRGGAHVSGPPFARYLTMHEPFEAEVGFPFVGGLEATDGIEIVDLPGGRVVTVRHLGSYDTVGETWDRAAAWIGEHGLTVLGPPWECYLTGPDESGSPITEIVWPVG